MVGVELIVHSGVGCIVIPEEVAAGVVGQFDHDVIAVIQRSDLLGILWMSFKMLLDGDHETISTGQLATEFNERAS